MTNIHNPILGGFHPDPSIIRVEDDYYIATSTFEWFPGVQIHHSKDLIHWETISHPLRRISQLNLRGIPDSGGVWAPCLSYDNGTFYLCYTIVLNHDGIFWNMHNYLVTASDIKGEWSEPIFLNSDGFDPCLFHDSDGRKWLVHRSIDYRTPNRGIALQEFSLKEGSLVGEQTIIFERSSVGDAEGPNLYWRNGWYYLIVAEGGTGLGHCVTVARSRNLQGPYDIDPLNPMLTSRDDLFLPIQKAGHADIVETQNGEWYMVHLCGRPVPTRGVCILGRETCIQKVYWNEDGWLRLYGGGNKPREIIPAPELPEFVWENLNEREDFDSGSLHAQFQTLRIPYDGYYISLKERPGYLRLRGRESLNSRFEQSLVARSQGSFKYTAATCLEFEPVSFKQMAGLTCFYNTRSFHYLKVSCIEGIGKCLEIITCDNGEYAFPVKEPVRLKRGERIHLKAEMDYDKLQFYYSEDGRTWNIAGPILDAAILSDEHILGWAFTGAFVGICCQDLTGDHLPADFDFFEYAER